MDGFTRGVVYLAFIQHLKRSIETLQDQDESGQTTTTQQPPPPPRPPQAPASGHKTPIASPLDSWLAEWRSIVIRLRLMCYEKLICSAGTMATEVSSPTRGSVETEQPGEGQAEDEDDEEEKDGEDDGVYDEDDGVIILLWWPLRGDEDGTIC